MFDANLQVRSQFHRSEIAPPIYNHALAALDGWSGEAEAVTLLMTLSSPPSEDEALHAAGLPGSAPQSAGQSVPGSGASFPVQKDPLSDVSDHFTLRSRSNFGLS